MLIFAYYSIRGRKSLFVCLFALRPKSTAKVMAGRSVHLNLGFCDGVAEQFYIAIAMSESGEVSCKPMKGRQLMGGFQRGGGMGWGQGVVPPPPPEKSPKIGFLSILVRFPLKSQSYQVSIPCWVINQRNAI